MKCCDNPVCKKSGHNTELLKKKGTQYQKHTDKNYASIPKHWSQMIHTKYKCSYLQPEMLTGKIPHLQIVLHGVKAVDTRGVACCHMTQDST
jgi:hypothetical protein